ncbi:cell division protein FtsZ [Sphingomonas sp. IBVSS2]|uniref:cell division protein FtsZ n=1 Tax=Sphingomonas sp. IBVSS2 TaxID=1985172 RepID=UPI000A2E25BE|nr:cell division protein FtsZ [Sphingomonas sp. IBVSS2]OSZ65134.1 cell division protein FtsZ [Sphingomonas sp. IBVSS2]
MSIDFLPPDVDELTPKITVVGVGGAGGNAIANMIRADVQGVDFIVANTDAQALKQSSAGHRIQLGAKITQGLGAGSRPEIGRAAAEETIDNVQKALEGAHMVFIAAGMGGGTGTGAAPVIAKAARDMGILTVGVVTRPFAFEGKRRAASAEAGINELQKYVDTLIVIPNQNLFLIANANTTFKEAFEMADEVLQQGVRGITDLMVMPGLINLDFADVRSVMQEMGKAMMGTGEAEGDDRALIAAQKAIANPLLDGVSMNGAKGVIVSITGGEDMRLLEVDEAANHIRELVDPDANIIWGSAFNPELEGKIRVSVVATGIDADAQPMAAPRAAEQPRVFSFSTPRRTAAAEPAPIPAEPVVAEEAPLEPPVPEAYTPEVAAEPAPLSPPIPQAYEPEPQPAALVQASWVDDGKDSDEDELVLGAESLVPEAPRAPIDEPAPTPATRRRWLTGGDEEEAAPSIPAEKPAKKSGGTLFERMAMASRGASKSDDDDDKDPLDIPRFLRSQNNQ